MSYLTIQEAKQRLRLPELCVRLELPDDYPQVDGVKFPCFRPERHSHGDRNPSCNFFDQGRRFHCFGCGASGDGPDLIALVCGVTKEYGVRLFVNLASGDLTSIRPTGTATDNSRRELKGDEWGDNLDKQSKRSGWPRFSAGSEAQLKQLAATRGFSMATVVRAQKEGILVFGNFGRHEFWGLRTPCSRCAQIRRLDRCHWNLKGGRNPKALTLAGSCAGVPLGIDHLTGNKQIVALTEGGPDFLAVRELAAARGDVAVLGLLGASVNLSTPVLNILSKCRVRIFPHADQPGMDAAARWAEALNQVDCSVDAMRFSDFNVTDANEFLQLAATQRDFDIFPLNEFRTPDL